jgi:hypothetical protein
VQHGVSPIAQPVAVAGDGSHNPKRFLLDVMSDSRVELHLRIEAAKALLPYCNN